MNILSIFITGLFAGGLTCLAVQGGLLASCIAQQESDTSGNNLHRSIPVLSFLLTRLLTYTLVGGILGTLGQFAQPSLIFRVILQFAVALFMIGTALNLLEVHPIFRYFIIQPPKFLTRLVHNRSKSKNIFAPAILGAFTVLIPCGATQAMMAYAVSTGSPMQGIITMFMFILGTSPLFFLFGYIANTLNDARKVNFNKIAAFAIILIALYNINGAIALSGSNLTFENILTDIHCTISYCNKSTTDTLAQPVTSASIYLTRAGYKLEPESITVKAGSNVTLKLINQDGYGCIQEFTIPKLGISKIIQTGKSDEINFTAPDQTGPLSFMCGMGMFRGVINVQ